MFAYLDSSAIAKLVIEERESDALRRKVADAISRAATSVVSEIEARRALRRIHPPEEDVERLEDALRAFEMIELDGVLRDQVVRLDPPELRTMDAVHLASALSVGHELDAFVCYDAQLSAAAAAHGLPVLAPN